MTKNSEDLDYNRQLWKFAKAYCHRYTIKTFADLTSIPINTLSRNLNVEKDNANLEGTFAGATFNKVARWARELEEEKLAEGLPVELNGFELPQRPGGQRGERKSNGASEEAQDDRASADGPADAGEIPSADLRTEAGEDSYGDENGADDGIADGTEIVIPAGVSITRPELRGRALELWSKPAFFSEDLTSDDLERTFGITLLAAADTKDIYAGWRGPSLPEGVTLTEEMHDEIARLVQDWLRYAYAYEICDKVENLKRQYAFGYILRGKLELEVLLIREYWMTPPDDESSRRKLRRDREIEWRVERIAELKDIEYPSFQELLVFGTIRIGRAVFGAVSKAAAWSLRRIFRRTGRTEH